MFHVGTPVFGRHHHCNWFCVFILHCEIMTKVLERTQNISGELAKVYTPDVPSSGCQSWPIKTAVAKHLWKSDPRLFGPGIWKPSDPKSMTVFSNLPEVMEQNLGRARSISQSPAAQIALVSTVTPSLLTRAILNVSYFSHKFSVRALCTHRQKVVSPCLIPVFDSYLLPTTSEVCWYSGPVKGTCRVLLPRVSCSPCSSSVSILSRWHPWLSGSHLTENWIEKFSSLRPAASTSDTFTLHSAGTLIFQSPVSLYPVFWYLGAAEASHSPKIGHSII